MITSPPYTNFTVAKCLTHIGTEGEARLFAAALGMTVSDAADLRDALLEAVQTEAAQLGRRDDYGQRYTVDFLLEWRGRRAMIRSAWIIEYDADAPRLTTCYPL